MHATKRSLLPALVTTSMVAVLASTPVSAVAVADDGDRWTPKTLAVSGDDPASEALDEARLLFEDGGADRSHARDATMVLRDLAIARSSLTGVERLEADRILARPDDGAGSDPDGYQAGAVVKSSCDSVCVHWVETTDDAVEPADAGGNGRPDYVDSVISTMEHVHDTYVAAGYRAPKPDGTEGGNAKPDIYLANIGDDDLYGYCTSDDPTVSPTGPYDAWAYCVLDDDYSTAEFPTNSPIENMQVTAAHEYFHAVQFGYDMLEDAWFMEATATWVEDEVYDDVDDNLNYLGTGPLARPGTSMDTFVNGGTFQYGTWIFFRFLSERYPAEVGGLPTLVRDMWTRADGSAAGPDQYSMQAVAGVLRDRGTTLPVMFAAFADGNRRPVTTYSEGVLHGYPSSPDGRFVVKDGWATTRLDHLSSASTAVRPRTGFSKLRVIVDMAPKATGSAAVVTSTDAGGKVTTSRIVLDRKGNGSLTVRFSPKTVQQVDVTLVNASTRYKCWNGTRFSCQGIPVHDDRGARLRGVLIR